MPQKIKCFYAAMTVVTLLFTSTSWAQVSMGTIMENAIATIGGAMGSGLAAAQAADPTQNLFPACPVGQGAAAVQNYIARTPGLDAAIASGDMTTANNLIASAIAACPNGAATITPGIANP